MNSGKIDCIIMASGLSVRYGRNKLLERLDGREIILHTAGHLLEAGLAPLVVTRSPDVRGLLLGESIPCILHDGARKSDTMHVGLNALDGGAAGYLFMPGDQPLVLSSSIRRLVRHFEQKPDRTVRLGFDRTPGSPVLFPAAFREDLLAYTGDRGGMEVLRNRQAPCDMVQASYAWELWDVDTPEKMARVQKIYSEQCSKFDKNQPL